MGQINFLLNETLLNIELLANETNAVLWARNLSYDKQFFVSSNYQKIWQRECITLYQDPLIWNTYLVSENQDQVVFKLKQRNTPINPKHTENYCFYLPDGTKQWCIDRSTPINNSNNECLMITGVALPISESQLFGDAYIEASDLIDSIILKYYGLLCPEIEHYQLNKNSEFYKNVCKLTEREKEVLHHILCGLTSKQIANKLSISYRTVETHFNSIKNKFNCNSKSELISNAVESNYIRIFYG